MLFRQEGEFTVADDFTAVFTYKIFGNDFRNHVILGRFCPDGADVRIFCYNPSVLDPISFSNPSFSS